MTVSFFYGNSHFSFLISHFSFLISHFSFLAAPQKVDTEW